jgi:hypothetical protein
MRRPLLLAVAACLAVHPLHADDGAASIAAGGLVLMKREPRTTMAKEILQISPRRVTVDYDFRNDSDVPITTVVAFPVPAYTFGEDSETFGDPAFSDFQLTIDGSHATFSIETRAFADKRDITALLARSHIDAATFGNWDSKQHDYDVIPDFRRASPQAQQLLTTAGAFKDGEPNWSVAKKYYWTQTFPPHTTIHIRHQYTPAIGGMNSVGYGLTEPADPYEAKQMDSLCLEPASRARLTALSQRNDRQVPYNYVDFILTTANTWKTPIEDFTLIVERPEADKSRRSLEPKIDPMDESLVSFCWNGPVTKTDANHFTAHQTNFIPTKELRIGYISVDRVNPNN